MIRVEKYIYQNKSGTFKVHLINKNYKFIKSYKTLEEAKLILDDILKKQIEIKHIESLINNSDPKILVSEQYNYILLKYNWRINILGYATATIDNVSWLLHRYIKIVLEDSKLNTNNPIDHINGIRYDNTNENLRIVTHAENSRNKLKKSGTISIHYGVSYAKGKYIVYLQNSGLRLSAAYDKENHAAWQYNLWIDEYEITHINKNIIDEPTDFKLHVKSIKINNLPKGISKNNNGFNINFKKIQTFCKNYKEAIIILDKYKKDDENERILVIKSIPIQRNTEGFAIIQKIRKSETIDIIIDDDNYYGLLIIDRISLSKYVSITIDNKKKLLHRYILDYCGDDVVDHINNNPLDNRKQNLRILTRKQNSQNRLSKQNSSSIYIGVSWNTSHNKWKATITIDGKEKHLGYFTNETDAAIERDKNTLIYNKEFGKLNF